MFKAFGKPMSPAPAVFILFYCLKKVRKIPVWHLKAQRM